MRKQKRREITDMSDIVQNFTGVNREAEKTVIRFYEIQLGMRCVRVMKFHNGQMLCTFKCYTYPLTKQVQIGKKEKKKKVYEQFYKHLPFKVFIALVAGYPNHSIINSLGLYCPTW